MFSDGIRGTPGSGRVVSASGTRGALRAGSEISQSRRAGDPGTAAIAADISLDSVLNLGLEPEEDPLFRAAFIRQYPHVDIQSLVGASDERLDGLANGVKGKYFEMLVCDRLNAGERVGELQLLPGQTARLAESSTQTGWDAVIENQDGSTDELLQFKATESMGYVKEALVKHPDIRVVVPTEVDDRADDIMGTDISNEELDNITQAQIGEMSESAVEDLLDKGAEAALDSFPFASMIATGCHGGKPCADWTFDPPGVLPKGSKASGEGQRIQCHRGGPRTYRSCHSGRDGIESR